MRVLFFSIFSLFLFVGCGRNVPEPRERKPIVLVSIAPYRCLVEQIAGEWLEVKTIVPANANPHSFEPTARQVLESLQGKIWFRIGEPFEEKILSVFKERNPDLSVCDLRSGIELISTGEEGEEPSHSFDRHIWLSPALASLQVGTVAQALSERFPEKREQFQDNLQRCRAQLHSLDREIHTLLEPLQDRVFLVSHPAFGYFCRDYHLEQLSIEQEGKDPRPRHLESILERAQQGHAEIALALPQYNNKGVQLVAQRLNVPVRMVDPYSSDYFMMLRKLAQCIADPQGIEKSL